MGADAILHLIHQRGDTIRTGKCRCGDERRFSALLSDHLKHRIFSFYLIERIEDNIHKCGIDQVPQVVLVGL